MEIWAEDKEKTDDTKTKQNPEQANRKHSKTKLPRFSRLLLHLASKQESHAVARKMRNVAFLPTPNNCSIVIYIYRIKADVNAKLQISNNTIPHVIFPTPLHLKYQDHPLGVDPSCWGLQRVNTLG